MSEADRRVDGARGAEPTLPELLAARWRRAGRPGRLLASVAAGLALAAVAWLVLAGGGGSFAYSGAQAPPFSLSWSQLERIAPRQGELLRLEDEIGSQILTVTLLAPFGAEPDGGGGRLARLGLAAERAREEIEREVPGARVVLEGRTELAVDRGPAAYQLGFVAPGESAGEIVVGKRLLTPDPERPGEGVVVEITETTARPAVREKVEGAPSGFFANWPIQILLEAEASVRTENALEQPLRSFSFG